MPNRRKPRATATAASRHSQIPRSWRLSWTSAVAITDATAREVVRAHLDAHAVAEQDANTELTHLSARIGQQLVPVVELDLELGVGQRINDGAVHLDGVV